MKTNFKRIQQLAGISINENKINDITDLYDRITGLSSKEDLEELEGQIRILVTLWTSEGGDKSDVKDFVNKLIDDAPDFNED